MINNKILRNYWNKKPPTKEMKLEAKVNRQIKEIHTETATRAKKRTLYTKHYQYREVK